MYEVRLAIMGQLTPRQKIMATRLIRESTVEVLAMDEMTAERTKLQEKAELLVQFNPSTDAPTNISDVPAVEWPPERVLIEGRDFAKGDLPEQAVQPLQSHEEVDEELGQTPPQT